MNPTEQQLRCWKPRPPSPKIKETLFGPYGSGVLEERNPTWTIPAFAFLVMVLYMVMGRPGENGISPASARSALLGSLSNTLQGPAVTEHSKRNEPPQVLLAFTNSPLQHSTAEQ